MNTYPERIIPSETEAGIVSLHLKRYDFSLPYCKDKTVLDVACGVGYGSSYLGKVARRVVGVEIDKESVEYARSHYQSAHVTFEEMDAAKLRFEDSSFDVVCSFETIEHLRDIPAYLSEITRVLKKDGVYVVSTPQVAKTNPRPANPFHTVEFSKKDFTDLLGNFFGNLDVFGQRRVQSDFHYYLQKLDVLSLRSRLVPRFLTKKIAKKLDTVPIDELGLENILISKEKLERAAELVVACRNPLKNGK